MLPPSTLPRRLACATSAMWTSGDSISASTPSSSLSAPIAEQHNRSPHVLRGYNEMEARSFGKTDMQVSRLGFGSYKMSGKAGGSTVEEVSRLLGEALDRGLNVIDTAECYGQSEELIGRAV